MIYSQIPNVILESLIFTNMLSSKTLFRCMKRHDDIFKKMFDRDESRIPYEKKYLNETIGE